MISEIVKEPKVQKGFGLSGIPVDDVLMDQALEIIEAMIREGGVHQVATANVDFMLNAKKDVEYRHILCMCDLVVADGMPIVWASGLFGTQLRERVAGSDMVPHLARLSAEKGYKIFLLGATPEVMDRAIREMETTNPGVCIVGRLSPPIRPLDQFDNDPILAAIEAANPDILLVAFGSPKQEKWISRNRHKLKVPVCIGVGGSLDFMAGTVRRAPMWMQKSGLEWLFRTCVDPQRLIPRYFADFVWMARYLFVQLSVQQSFRHRQQGLDFIRDSIGSVNVIGINGSMTGPDLENLGDVLSAAVESGRPLVLDMTATTHLGADGLWTLIAVMRRAAQNSCELWLSSLSPSVERQIRAAHFEGIFQIATSSAEAARRIVGNHPDETAFRRAQTQQIAGAA